MCSALLNTSHWPVTCAQLIYCHIPLAVQGHDGFLSCGLDKANLHPAEYQCGEFIRGDHVWTYHGLQQLKAKVQDLQGLPTREKCAGQAGGLPGVTLLYLHCTFQADETLQALSDSSCP